MKWGSTIKGVRKDNDLNMEDFGLMIGVTTGYISLLERDMRQPSVALITEIERLFGIQFEVLRRLKRSS